MAHHVIIALNAVATVHVAGHTGDIERLAAVVALDERDHLRRRLARVEQAANTQRSLQAKRDFGLHIGKLLLEQLRLRERASELPTIKSVLACPMPAVLGGTQNAPRDAEARPIEATERALQAGDVRQDLLFTDHDAVHDDFAGNRRTQRQLAGNLRRTEASHALFQDEAADRVAVGLGFRPDDEDIGDRTVGDPGLGARQAIPVAHLLGPGAHRRRV